MLRQEIETNENDNANAAFSAALIRRASSGQIRGCRNTPWCKWKAAPAKRPSFWTKSVSFVQNFGKTSDYRMAAN
jgi:hypothetical protein